MSRNYRQPDQVPARRFSAAQFQRWVMRFAQVHGWAAHPLATPGELFRCSLVLVHGPVLLFRELLTENATASPAQAAWITALEHAGQDVAVWRPRDEKLIEEALRRRTQSNEGAGR